MHPRSSADASSHAGFDPSAFVVVAIAAGLIRAVMLPLDLIGSAVAYAIAGCSCAWILRTRIPDVPRRVLVWLVWPPSFAVCGVWGEFLPLMTPDMLLPYAIGPWAIAGAILGIPLLSRGALLAAPMLAALSFALAGAAIGAATRAAVSVGWLGELVLETVLPIALVCVIGGSLFDYFCAGMGLHSAARGMDRFRVQPDAK